MPKKWTPERAKAETDTKILGALAQESPLRWSELLKKIQLSSRTLKAALVRMELKGLVYRKMKIGREYPPPVYYGLTPEGKRQNEPSEFALALWLEIFASGRQKIISSDKDLEQSLSNLGGILGATYLFSILKALEFHDLNWLDKIHESSFDYRLFDSKIARALKLSERIVRDEKETSLAERLKGRTVPPLEEQDIKKLQILLKKVYPDVIGRIEDWFKEWEEAAELRGK